MDITIDDVPTYQVLDIKQGDISFLSLFVSGLDDAQAAALTASLGGTDSLFFQDPPSVLSATPTIVPSQYLVILGLTGAVANGGGGFLHCEVFDLKLPLDPTLTVTVTSGNLSSNGFDVLAVFINPQN